MRKATLAVCCMAMLAAGCGGGGGTRTVSKDEGETSTLYEVGEACRYYQGNRNAAPKKLSDLATVKGMAANGYESVRSGGVILRYGATLPNLDEEPGDGSSDEVLAFFPQVPESGGKVLLLDRSVKTMTAEQFKAARLAGSESSKMEEAKKK